MPATKAAPTERIIGPAQPRTAAAEPAGRSVGRVPQLTGWTQARRRHAGRPQFVLWQACNGDGGAGVPACQQRAGRRAATTAAQCALPHMRRNGVGTAACTHGIAARRPQPRRPPARTVVARGLARMARHAVLSNARAHRERTGGIP
jgi:hypothetical protein